MPNNHVTSSAQIKWGFALQINTETSWMVLYVFPITIKWWDLDCFVLLFNILRQLKSESWLNWFESLPKTPHSHIDHTFYDTTCCCAFIVEYLIQLLLLFFFPSKSILISQYHYRKINIFLIFVRARRGKCLDLALRVEVKKKKAAAVCCFWGIVWLHDIVTDHS